MTVRKQLRMAALAAVVTAVAVGVQLSSPPPAHALSGLQRTIGLSGGGTDPVKTASARCQHGKWVVGGGAFIDDGGRNRVRLTQLRPIHDPGGSDRFVAGATAPSLGTSFEWTLAVFTVCANPRDLSRYDIVIDSSERSFASKKSALARCPGGTVAYGTGAETTGAAGHVGLQLNRTSGPLDISRAFAETTPVPSRRGTSSPMRSARHRPGASARPVRAHPAPMRRSPARPAPSRTAPEAAEGSLRTGSCGSTRSSRAATSGP